MSSMKCISFNSLNFPAHLHIRHPEKITIYTNYIFYHITSASLSWNPFIHFLHTLHSIPSPDIVTGWHILCLIYFLYNTSLNQTRTEISTFLMSLHQALPHSPPQRVHQALSLAKWPGTFPHPLCGLLTPMCWRPSELMIDFLHLRQPSLTTCCLCPPRVLTNGTLLYFIFKIALLQVQIRTCTV